ncbi:MAG: GNAT family N-acetyltransferase [Mycetocola sp.]
MLIRDAHDDDWDGIWPFLGEIVAAGETYCWPADTSEENARAWWMKKPGGRVFVAVDEDGTVLGTAELHPNQPAAGSHVANAGFMVAPTAVGRGIGRALAVHVLDRAAGDGYTAMQFNAVVETNTGAIALWQSLGFRILATVPEAFDSPSSGLVGLHIMHRMLERASS